jgi:hypothetical protein
VLRESTNASRIRIAIFFEAQSSIPHHDASDGKSMPLVSNFSARHEAVHYNDRLRMKGVELGRTEFERRQRKPFTSSGEA